MTFAQTWILHFLWLLPVVGLALLAYHRRRGRPWPASPSPSSSPA